MQSHSRRAFLATSSMALAGLSVGMSRQGIALPFRSRQPVAKFGPDMIDPATLRTLAIGGIDAARSAGATYADIRVSDLRSLEMYHGLIPTPFADLRYEFGYGIRVQVDGAWAFAFGSELHADDIARSVRSAINTARGMSTLAPRRHEFVPSPVVTGEWSTPVQIDPLTISPDDVGKMLGAYIDAASRVLDGGLAQCAVRWDVETRVFASTEGSLTTQRTVGMDPRLWVEAAQVESGVGRTSVPIRGVATKGGGFENLLGPAMQEEIKAATEESARLTRFPTARAELGRMPAVFDGTAMAAMLTGTLAQALRMERALGYEADGAGTSFLAPINDVVGQPLFSPLLNVTADRAVPHYGAVKWDDEGVPTEAYPVIEQGRVVDYFATRLTTPALADWYAKRGKAIKPHGAAVAWKPSTSPTGCASHLTVGTGSPGNTLDALVKQLSNGILMRGTDNWGYSAGVTSDPQLSGGSFIPMMMYEVKKGQITRRLTGGMMPFATKNFWSAISALGDASSVENFVQTSYLESGIRTTLPVVAPAALLRQIDVVSLGRNA